MQKLIKLTRLIRFLKILKGKKRMFKQVSLIFGAGFERLILLILLSAMCCHVFSCLWVFIAQFVDENDPTWMDGDV